MTSQPLILHHKHVSPLSEKIRLLLGYTGLPWHSLLAPLAPPRPSIDPLLDGYRHIPVAQRGSDIFCDTRTIAHEIAQASGRNELSPFHQSPEVVAFLEELQTDAFFACVVSLPALGTLKSMFRQVPLGKWAYYLRDKKLLGSLAKLDVPPRKVATERWQALLRELEVKLETHTYLFGAEAPSIADFAAVHLIWFRIDKDGPAMLKALPRLHRWYEAMVAIGHGNMLAERNAEQTLQIAKTSAPRSIADAMTQGPLVGTRVRIAPTAIATAATEGRVVGESNDRLILARDTEAAGVVHVHFPKRGYEIQRC